MATGDERVLNTVGHLLQLTQDKQLQWQPQQVPAQVGDSKSSEYTDQIFTTKFNERELRLVKVRYWYEPNEMARVIYGAFLPSGPTARWMDDVYLEFIDDFGNGLWRFPSVPLLKDLLSEVQYNAAGVDEFLNSIPQAPRNLADEKGVIDWIDLGPVTHPGRYLIGSGTTGSVIVEQKHIDWVKQHGEPYEVTLRQKRNPASTKKLWLIENMVPKG